MLKKIKIDVTYLGEFYNPHAGHAPSQFYLN